MRAMGGHRVWIARASPRCHVHLQLGSFTQAAAALAPLQPGARPSTGQATWSNAGPRPAPACGPHPVETPLDRALNPLPPSQLPRVPPVKPPVDRSVRGRAAAGCRDRRGARPAAARDAMHTAGQQQQLSNLVLRGAHDPPFTAPHHRVNSPPPPAAALLAGAGDAPQGAAAARLVVHRRPHEGVHGPPRLTY